MALASRSGLIFSTRGPGATGPVRTLGPARSMATRRSVPSSAAAARRCSSIAAHSRGPSWAQLMRATSMPTATMRLTSAGSRAASVGIVTMMRVARRSRA